MDEKSKNKLINFTKVQRFEIYFEKNEFESKIKAESEVFNKKTQLITIIVAASENNIIGNDNNLFGI